MEERISGTLGWGFSGNVEGYSGGRSQARLGRHVRTKAKGHRGPAADMPTPPFPHSHLSTKILLLVGFCRIQKRPISPHLPGMLYIGPQPPPPHVLSSPAFRAGFLDHCDTTTPIPASSLLCARHTSCSLSLSPGRPGVSSGFWQILTLSQP